MRVVVSVVVSAAALSAAPPAAQAPQDFVDRAEAAFAAGRLDDALSAFERVTALDPEATPWLWQRGITLYYLGRFEACADQFAAYKRVNPADLESAVWHMACVSRWRSVDEARASMLPPGRDARVMRAEVYEMFAGRLPPDAVVGRAGFIGDLALFYAHFYAGLFAEIHGDDDSAARHLRLAASDRFAEYGGFMNVVAQHHWAQVGRVRNPGAVVTDPATRRVP